MENYVGIATSHRPKATPGDRASAGPVASGARAPSSQESCKDSPREQQQLMSKRGTWKESQGHRHPGGAGQCPLQGVEARQGGGLPRWLCRH